LKTIIANFGVKNYLWEDCLRNSTIATFEVEILRPYWEANDKEGFIAKSIATQKTAAGLTPTKSTASRWFNISTVVSTTDGDLWIHREKDEIWWTISKSGEPTVTLEPANDPRAKLGEKVYVIRKPAEAWSNKNKKGVRVDWNGLHPKAREFLFTEGTLQALNPSNAEYAQAWINGDSLDAWHNQPAWLEKEKSKKNSPVSFSDAKQKAAWRMANTAWNTTENAKGQQELRKVKNKDFCFESQYALEQYALALIESQEGLCAISGLQLQLDETSEIRDLFCSLDRIDSAGHYAPNNLQVVCQFINRWKGADDNLRFKELLSLICAEGYVNV
jgi:hypothetical protein